MAAPAGKDARVSVLVVVGLFPSRSEHPMEYRRGLVESTVAAAVAAALVVVAGVVAAVAAAVVVVAVGLVDLGPPSLVVMRAAAD